MRGEGKDGEGKGVQMKAFKMYQKLGQMKKRSGGGGGGGRKKRKRRIKRRKEAE